MIIEFTQPGTGRRVLVNRKSHSVVVMVDGSEVLSFDLAGRLLFASREGVLLQRGLDNRVLRVNGGHEILDEATSRPYLDHAYCELKALADHAPPAARMALAPALLCSPRQLRIEARRFAGIYDRIPILPPDQYQALYLQATIGCAFNRCAFCRFYRERRFRVRSVGEFTSHLGQVLEFLGTDVLRRRTVFLGDANALVAPASDLEIMMRLVRAALPGLPFYSFADATLHRTKTVGELERLRKLGLRRLTIGLETGHVPLYERLGKPGSFADAWRSISVAKEAGLGVGISVLVGLGGVASAEEHLENTARFLLRQRLGPGDIVYLSPIRVDPTSEYATLAGEPLTLEALRLQTQAFRERLFKLDSFKIANYDITRFLYQ